MKKGEIGEFMEFLDSKVKVALATASPELVTQSHKMEFFAGRQDCRYIYC